MSPRWEHEIPREGDVLVVKVTGVRFLVTCIDSAEEGWIDIIELDNQCKPSRICPRDLHYYDNEGPITDMLANRSRRIGEDLGKRLIQLGAMKVMKLLDENGPYLMNKEQIQKLKNSEEWVGEDGKKV